MSQLIYPYIHIACTAMFNSAGLVSSVRKWLYCVLLLIHSE
jgi:hypothetical protein